MGFVFRQVSSNSNDIEIFDTAFTDDYYVFLYENNTNKNNAIGMQSSTFSTGSIVSEVCNNSSRIKSNFIGTIYGSECGVFLNDTDITLWKWDGTKLVNKLVFIQTTYPYTKNIGNILSNITFQDMHIENLSEIFTLFQINNTNDYKFIKWKLLNDSNNNLYVDISDSTPSVNNSLYSFTSDVSGIKITKNKYYNTSTNEYLFFNVVENNSNNLIGIKESSSSWDLMERIDLTNKYDFSINFIESGTNITVPLYQRTTTNKNNYSMIYATSNTTDRIRRVVYKIELSDHYSIIDPSTLEPVVKNFEDTRINSTVKVRPQKKGFTKNKYDLSGLFISFSTGAEMPSPSWIYNNFGLDWKNSDDWDDLLEFYHAFEEPVIYVDNSPGSEYYNNNVLDESFYSNKTYTGNDSVFNLKTGEINNDISFGNIGHPKIHWSGDKGEDGMGAFPLFEYNGRAPETVYELGHLDKIVNKINGVNGVKQVWNDTMLIINPFGWVANKYNERGRPQYIRTINSEPWKYEKTMWWEVQVPENIEELTGITYANALQDKKYYIQFAKDYPEYGFTKGEFIYWSNESSNYKYFNKYAFSNTFYLPLKPDKFADTQ